MLDEQQNLKTLCNIIDPEPSGDDNLETQFDVGVLYAEQYDLLELSTFFGTEEFMKIYNSVINDIRQQELKIQASICNALLEKIEIIYDFIFPIRVSLLIQYDMDRVYNLVKFLQFDNLDFITNIWKSFNIKNVLTMDVDLFFENQSRVKKLVEQMTNLSLLYDSDTLINNFLNFCDKDTAIFTIKIMTKSLKNEITSNLMGEEN